MPKKRATSSPKPDRAKGLESPVQAADALGVLGGIFDPPHNGHLAIAALARDHFSFSRIVFVPAGNPPHKDCVGASAAHRLAMLQAAVKPDKTFEVLDCEIRRNGASYTFDTVQTLRRTFPGRPICFIIGSDNLSEITGWSRYRELLTLITLCVAHRPGHSLRVPPAIASVTDRIRTFPSPEWGISSTLVRSYLKRGYSCDHLLPESVISYIQKHGLYRQ